MLMEFPCLEPLLLLQAKSVEPLVIVRIKDVLTVVSEVWIKKTNLKEKQYICIVTNFNLILARRDM